MKLINLATVAVLSASILAGGATVLAEEARDVTTEGKIMFVPNVDEELEVIPPVTDPEVEIPPTIPGTTGPLSILFAPTMNFGEQAISNQDQIYNMIAETQKLVGSEERVPYVSMANVQDNRGNNEGWTLSVTASEFEATTTTLNSELKGAQISLLAPWVDYSGIDQTMAPSIHNEVLNLVPGTSSIIMNAEAEKGAGSSSIVWGDQAALTASTDEIVRNEFVQLFVPGSTAKDATTYSANLNWELTTGVDNSF